VASTEIAASRLDPGPETADARRLAVACCVIGFIFSTVLAVRSDGSYEDYDDLGHFECAAGVWRDARYLVHEWGRPGFTAPYALAALGGWAGARLLSAALSAMTAYLAYLSARRLGVRSAWLAAPLTLAQPLFFVLSYTTLTETPAAFYVALALCLLLHDRTIASSAVLSLALVTRWELIAFAPLWLFAFDWRNRRAWSSAAALVWAPLVHNIAALAVGWAPPVEVYFGSQHARYPSGNAAAFLAHLSTAAGLAIAVLGIAGCRGLLDRRRGWLVGAMVFVFLSVQTALHVRSAFASGGYARFVVAIAPLLGIAAARGWEMLSDASHHHGGATERRAVLAAFLLVDGGFELHRVWGGVWWGLGIAWAYRAVAACVLIVALLSWRAGRPRGVTVLTRIAFVLIAAHLVYVAEPLRLWPRHDEVRAAVHYAETHGLSGRPVHEASPRSASFTGRLLPADYTTYPERLEAAVAGNLAIWDEFYAEDSNVRTSLARMLVDPRWSLEHVAPPRPGHWPSIVLFERTAAP
jgi:hypothetical protein